MMQPKYLQHRDRVSFTIMSQSKENLEKKKKHSAQQQLAK